MKITMAARELSRIEIMLSESAKKDREYLWKHRENAPRKKAQSSSDLQKAQRNLATKKNLLKIIRKPLAKTGIENQPDITFELPFDSINLLTSMLQLSIKKTRRYVMKMESGADLEQENIRNQYNNMKAAIKERERIIEKLRGKNTGAMGSG
ncbi:MAG: hypothetical protein FWG10_13835 [Eubacteriaceae bacterium]|nr:hypothetical protein [Eubacteriaceae bacterium]